jgi:flagellin
MSVINTNVSSLIAQNSMTGNARAQSNAMQQLSTGLRINSAKDDAAGMAITSKMTSQIKGLDQAVRNGNDGISMLQTAEGAMVAMNDMLQRMRELSVQSASDSYTTTDRGNLNAEYKQLKAEITRIGANTQWNGMNILNGSTDLGTPSGSYRAVSFQVGAQASQTIDINMKNFTFTSSDTPSTPSVTTIALGSSTAGDDATHFQATIGGTNVDVTFTAMLAAPSAANATATAASLQAGLSKYSGLEGVKVAAVGTTITITDAAGNAVSNVKFKKADGTTDATDTAKFVTTLNNGTGGIAAVPAGAVFTVGLAGSAIDTKANANTAIAALDTALNSVSTERATIGATINRLTYTVDNLTNVSQNASASRSRVQDTDYAKASTELARTQIIAQAATAMLAQANQSQQSVLALLK